MAEKELGMSLLRWLDLKAGQLVDRIDLKSILVVIVFLQAGLIGYLMFDLPRQEEKEPELTKYQENYVNCPPEYLEVCTELSKVPTEEVTFQRAEEDRIYLKLGDGRTMIADLKGNGEAEIIAME